MPSAVICSHSDLAVSLIKALRERGLRCPEDISVVAFSVAFTGSPEILAELTLVRADGESSVREMMRLLGKQFAGDRDRPEHVHTPFKLLVRRSAGAVKK